MAPIAGNNGTAPEFAWRGAMARGKVLNMFLFGFSKAETHGQ
jgi:hypothetical protein